MSQRKTVARWVQHDEGRWWLWWWWFVRGTLRGKAWGKAAGMAEVAWDGGVRSEPMQCTVCWVRRRTDWTLRRILIQSFGQGFFWFFNICTWLSCLHKVPCVRCDWTCVSVTTCTVSLHLMQQKAFGQFVFFSKYYVYFKYKSCLWAKQVVHKRGKYNAWNQNEEERQRNRHKEMKKETNVKIRNMFGCMIWRKKGQIYVQVGGH